VLGCGVHTALAGLHGDRDRLLRRQAQAIPTCQATVTGERHLMGCAIGLLPGRSGRPPGGALCREFAGSLSRVKAPEWSAAGGRRHRVVVAPAVQRAVQTTEWAMPSSSSAVPPGPVAWMPRCAESGSLG
jgi:hypothetical protein